MKISLTVESNEFLPQETIDRFCALAHAKGKAPAAYLSEVIKRTVTESSERPIYPQPEEVEA